MSYRSLTCLQVQSRPQMSWNCWRADRVGWQIWDQVMEDWWVHVESSGRSSISLDKLLFWSHIKGHLNISITNLNHIYIKKKQYWWNSLAKCSEKIKYTVLRLLDDWLTPWWHLIVNEKNVFFLFLNAVVSLHVMNGLELPFHLTCWWILTHRPACHIICVHVFAL